MSRVVLAMSGGVDSSVAAYLLLRAGHEVVGVFMRHGEESPATQCMVSGDRNSAAALLPVLSQRADHKQGCCSASDAEDARRVADRLDIPFYALNLQAEFQQIIDYFVDEYAQGRTPNPCVMCNNWLKFGKLFDYADSIGAEFVATGHYARIASGGVGDGEKGRENQLLSPSPSLPLSPSILRGVDLDKDQAYVLFGIERALLPRMLLPVGGFRKSEIRAMAAEIGLRVAEKKDSQEICFVTSGKHDEFVRARSNKDRAGQIVTTEGRVVGVHNGIERFTIGQRKGLAVAMGERYFVVRIEPSTRRVVIGRHEELGRSELTAQRTNWQVDVPQHPFRCLAKIRYNAAPSAATATVLADARLHVQFDEPRFGVAPGQAVVCFDGERMLGGGWIE